MRYTALKSEFALETLETVRRGELPAEGALVERGNGPDHVRESLPELERVLYEIKARYPGRLLRRDPQGGQFEICACTEVHRLLPFDPEMLADPEFWSWLAICQFHELVDWRHGGDTGEAALANFGIGNTKENLLYRMWLRADVAFRGGDRDPYALARRGDQDFWRSHVFRQSYGRCRSLVRALLRFQFPDGAESPPTLKTSEIRALAKRLCRLHPNVVFEYLDEESALRLIAREAEQAQRAVAASSADT